MGTAQHPASDDTSPGLSDAPAEIPEAAHGAAPSRSEQTRARILDAAEDAFGRLGYHAASIVEITRSAGVGLGTFYVYFPSKLEIYRHLLRSRQQDFINSARAATTEAGDYREAVRAGFAAFFEWIGERPFVMRALREAEFIDPSLRADLYAAPAGEYRRRLEKAMELGLIERADASMLAWCLMGMTEFVAMHWLVWPGEKRIDPERFDSFVEILIRALAVRPPKT